MPPVSRARTFIRGCLAQFQLYDWADDDPAANIVILNLILGALALLSLALTLWQWLVARRFPLHQRALHPAGSPAPGVTLLKPLKGCDAATESCLRSWLVQDYAGPVQVLFGVADAEDPVCAVVRKLLAEFPGHDAELVTCGPPRGANAKVSQLAELERRVKHETIVISDADVEVPPDLLVDVVARLAEPVPGQGASARSTGLVCCFYRLANPTSLAMQWEAIAINADFWSQVLQSRSLKPIDFALGAVMAARRQLLKEIGGFAALIDSLADDYLLGNRIARRGCGIDLSPVVVDCRSSTMGWVAVWRHQLRWARTIRVCQPVPYFFSILSNATLWPLVWLLARPIPSVAVCAGVCWLVRILTAVNLQRRLHDLPPPGARTFLSAPGPEGTSALGVSIAPLPAERCCGQECPRSECEDARPPEAATGDAWRHAWLVPVKDLLQAAVWLLSFLGNRIEWRGQRFRLRRDGVLEAD